ncbi:MAG TPA: hypothetical protein VGJ73_01110, partial [Verrucomicrobiae bacterium]
GRRWFDAIYDHSGSRIQRVKSPGKILQGFQFAASQRVGMADRQMDLTSPYQKSTNPISHHLAVHL